jgi:hypothetical protein
MPMADGSGLLQVLEVTTEAMERRVEQDFADAYEASDLYRQGSRLRSQSFVASL